MLSRKTLILLALAALLAVALAVFLSRERPEPAPSALLPELSAQLKDVAQIGIKSAQGEVTLVRSDNQWRVREKANFPASSAKLREALQGLVGLSAPEAKTRDPKLYERVGLDPEKGEKPTRLELRDNAGKPMAALWIGRTRALATDMQRNEYFVRRGDEDQVWRVEGRLPADTTPEYWIERQVLNLDRARIRALAVTPREADAFRISRATAEQPEFSLEGLGAGEKIESPLRFNSMVSAVQNLSSEDVLAPDTAAALQQQGSVTAETFDGLHVEIQLLAADQKRYARLEAGGTDEAARLNERWRGWTYQLADYQADSLFVKRGDLLQTAVAEDKGSLPPATTPPVSPEPLR
jgi:hypothetical protein